MGKYIGQIYKHGQSQLSTPLIKSPILSYSDSQTSSFIEFTITSVPFVIEKEKNQFCFVFQKFHPRLLKHHK